MRFCPFCAQENTDAAAECAHCGRRLPSLASATPVARQAPPQPTLRPPPVRAFPRGRVLTPAVALPSPARPTTPTSPLVQARATAPLGEVEGSTRVEDSPFDGPTTQQPRLEPLEEASPRAALVAAQNALPQELGEHSDTAIRLPPPRLHAPADDEEVTSVRDESTQVDDSPIGDAATPVSARPAPIPGAVPKSSAGSASGRPVTGVRARPTPSAHPVVSPSAPLPLRGPVLAPLEPPPVPLPPPPAGALIDPRVEAPELIGDPRLDLRTATPAANAVVPAANEVGSSDEPEPPPPMPPAPPPGLLPALKYLVPLGRAIWARQEAQARLRALLHDDQRHVDEALHQLGQAAWKLTPRPPELRPELDRADEDDARRRTADQGVARLDMSLSAERERFSGDEAQRRADLAARDGVIHRLVEDLAERRRAQRTEQKTLREIEGRLRVAEKTLASLLGKAAKAETAPPEKGGGANAAANLRQQAEPVRREIDGFRPEYEAQAERVRALDAPILGIENKLGEERGALVVAKAELEAARRAHQSRLVELGIERAGHEDTLGTAEKSVRLRLVSTGTLLSLHRLDPIAHGEVFGAIYQHLDELQAVAAARDSRIGQLEEERRGYDRPALQRGLILLGGAFALALLLLFVFVALLRR